jgi:hypothetical protein
MDRSKTLHSDLRQRLERLGVTRGLPDKPKPPAPSPQPAPRAGIEAVVDGELVETPLGPCFVAEEARPADADYGNVSLSDIHIHGRHMVAAIAQDDGLREIDFNRAAFIDTETSSVVGGTGTYAFLVGVGFFDGPTFRVRQFFMRDPSEEPALIHLLENFEETGGVGASGLPFFTVPGLVGAPVELMRDIILLKSLADALDLLASDAFASTFGGSTRLNDYRWGKIHRITFSHIGQFSWPFDLPPDGSGFPTDGGYQVPDRSDPNVRGSKAEDFRFRSGPSRRYVAELRPDGIRTFQVLPGGQSGVLGARHYGDQLPLWLTNAFHPLLTAKHEILENTETWQDFFPISGSRQDP